MSKAYAPPQPITASVNHVLTQDVIATSKILVDSTSVSPVGVFLNPFSQKTETLVVSSGQVSHAARTQSSEAGWQMTPLFNGAAALEVAAGTSSVTNPAQTAAHCFFQDGTSLYTSTLQPAGGGTPSWSTPVTATPAGLVTNLQVAYSPLGRIVLYGIDAGGDLVLTYQVGFGTPFTSITMATGGQLTSGDFQLSMTAEDQWSLVGNVGQTPVLFSGTLEDSNCTSQPISQLQGILQNVALTFWSSSQETLYFLLVDTSGNLNVVSSSSGTQQLQTIPNGKAAKATGHISSADGTLHVYSVDDSFGLWVLHQDPDNPWDPGTGLPVFTPYIALDRQIGTVVSDMNPAAAPVLFAVDAGDFSLRLHAQDVNTNAWTSDAVLQPAATAYEVTRYRSEVNLIDANGSPALNYPVTLNLDPSSSATDVCVAGASYVIDGSAPVPLSTDATGKLTLSVLANRGLAAPTLVLDVDGTTTKINPATAVHNYLSGQGTLNPTNPGGPNPNFDAGGATLSAATVNGQPLAPNAGTNAGLAAQSIQNAAQAGLGQSAPAGAVGFIITFGDEPRFQWYDDRAAFDAHPMFQVDSFLTDWLGDIWEGIENAVTSVVSFAVSLADKLATIVVNGIEQAIQFTITCLEDAAHVIMAVFRAIAAEVEKIIAWLKALFDFGAIWRTKMAFDQMLSSVPAYVSQLAQYAQTNGNQWFTQQQAAVNDAFATMIAQYGSGTFGQQPNWQTPGSGPSGTPLPGANAAPSDFTSNVHHNWLQDKMSSNSPSGASIPMTPLAAWSTFSTTFSDGATDFYTGLQELFTSLQTIISDPAQITGQSIAALLTGVQAVIDAALTLADGVFETLCELAQSVMTALSELLTTPLDLGFLNTLWQWLADIAGYSSDGQLTVSALLSLIAAFPSTIIYKLINGVDTEPFGSSLMAIASDPASNKLLAAILQMLCVVPALISVVLGADCPWWLTLGQIGLTAFIFYLYQGLPPLGTIEAVGVNVLWLGPLAYMVLMSVAASTQQAPLEILGDVAKAAETLSGLVLLVFGIVDAANGVGDKNVQAASILLPIPTMFSFLGMSMFQGNEAAAGALGVFDFIGYIGGGACKVIDAS